MSLILNIESATTVCSVSVSEEEKVLSLKELDEGFTHAENLHIFMREVLIEAGIRMGQLDAIAVSEGPGSYTGLRIGLSSAKGLCYALDRPMIALPTLQIMAAGAIELGENAEFLCPMIDARRMEVYTAVFDRSLNTLLPTNALIVDEQSVSAFSDYPGISFFGNGMEKCQPLLKNLPGARFMDKVKPSARFMGKLAAEKLRNREFADTAYFEPVYLKEFIAGKKKKAI